MSERVRWLWTSRSAAARAVRAGLWPMARGLRAAIEVRNLAYDRGWLRTVHAGCPTVVVGNLSVGGTGKTPVASWIARWYAAQGLRPAILMRGYGGDEGPLHRRLSPGIDVYAEADRVEAAHRARAAGAQVLVADDGFQHRRLARDLDLVLVAARSAEAVRAPLPSGPWREKVEAVRRADYVVLTRRTVDRAGADRWLARLEEMVPAERVIEAALGIGGWRALLSDEAVPLTQVAGARVLAVAGLADPWAFAAQLDELGASVVLHPLADHYVYRPITVRRVLHLAAGVDYVVTTEKDAGKLRPLWPASAPEPLVAVETLEWGRGSRVLTAALDAVVAGRGGRGSAPRQRDAEERADSGNEI